MTSRWRRLRAVARRWLSPSSRERDLHDELHAYLQHDIDARIEAGMAPSEARRAALAELGGVDQVKEQVRAGAAGAWIDTAVQDTRHACRAARRAPGYAAWVVGSLAIGMGAMIAALALLNAMLRLPFPEVTAQERLVRVSVSRNCGRPDCWIRLSSPADYAALQDGLHGLEGLAAHAQADTAVMLPGAHSVRGVLASANYFDVLGVRPALGRGFSPADAQGRAPVALIAHGVWTRDFGADPLVIGRSIGVAGEFVQVIGVAPPLFSGVDRIRPGGRAPDIWLPMWLADRIVPLTPAEQRRGERDLYFVGRLREGVEVSQVQAEASVLAARLAAARGQGPGLGEVRRVWRVDPRSWHFGVMVVMPIPILVLVISCVNAATLMLARGSQRQREIAIRLAIGASRGRMVRQLLLESGVLALLATALALPMAWWPLQLAGRAFGTAIPFDPVVLAWTALTAAGTTLAFGLVPALRVSAQRPSSTLGSVNTRSDAIPSQSRMRTALVVAQAALSLGLLATAWQLVGTVQSQAVSAGTPGDRLLIARFDLQPLRLPPAGIETFYERLLQSASRLAGVEAAGLARPTAVWTFGSGAGPASVAVWGPGDAPDRGHAVIGGYADGDLLEAVGLRVVSGRGFSDADRLGRLQVAVVNETAAKRLNGPAVGSVIRVARREQDFTSSIELRVVGVIEPALEPRYTADGPAAKIYLPSPIEPEPALALYLRARGQAAALAPGVRELVGRIDPRVPIREIGTLDEINERSYGYGPQLWLARAAAILGVLGLLLATAGLYGVSACVVAMRAREMAIRMALGATPRTILSLALHQSMRVAAIGLIAGGGSAVAASRIIQSEYHGIRGIDVAAFAGAVGLFLAAMLLAGAVPAIRASRLDPIETLKDA